MRMKRGVKKTSGRRNCRSCFHKSHTSRRLALGLERRPSSSTSKWWHYSDDDGSDYTELK
jgi:hypothetical protein